MGWDQAVDFQKVNMPPESTVTREMTADERIRSAGDRVASASSRLAEVAAAAEQSRRESAFKMAELEDAFRDYGRSIEELNSTLDAFGLAQNVPTLKGR